MRVVAGVAGTALGGVHPQRRIDLPTVGRDAVCRLHHGTVVLELDLGHMVQEVPAVEAITQLGVRHGVQDDRVDADVDECARRKPERLTPVRATTCRAQPGLPS